MDNIIHISIEKIQQKLNRRQPDSDPPFYHRDLEGPIPDEIKNLISGIKETQHIILFDNFTEPNELIENVHHPAVKFSFNLSVFIKEGTMNIRVGHKEYALKKNDWFTVLSGKIYQATFLSPDAKVQVCCLNEGFYTPSPDHTRVIGFYNRISQHPVVSLSDKNVSEYLVCIRQLKRHIEGNDDPLKSDFIKCYCNLIFLTLCSELLQNNTIIKHKLSRKELIYQSFLQEIEKHYKTQRSVKFYAERLCITPKYLSLVIYKLSGKYASEWIDVYIILEAKALLKTTNMPIQEIAYELNFSTPTHFGKFFKRVTGISPKQYRLLP